MPRAGWCRECRAWVWVDDAGACQSGHGAECVDHIREAEPTDIESLESGPDPAGDAAAGETGAIVQGGSRAVGDFGVGEFPPGLQRFNWGAFMLPALWGVVYGVWPIVGLWFLAAFAPLFLSLMFRTTTPGGTLIVSSLIGITVVSDLFVSFVRLWSGGSANRLLWTRETARLQTRPDARPRFTVRAFPGRQRVWLVWGALGLLGGLAFTLVTNYRTMQPYGLGEAFVFEPLMFLAAQIGLGVWLSRTMRREYPATVPVPEDSEGTGV